VGTLRDRPAATRRVRGPRRSRRLPGDRAGAREGAEYGAYVVLRNHTTRDLKWGSAFLGNHLLRLGNNKIQLLELIFAIALGVLAAPIVGNLPPALIASFGGVIAGSLIWHFVIKPRFLARFQRDGLLRITQTLDGLANTVAS
jgi:hypothetical protein